MSPVVDEAHRGGVAGTAGPGAGLVDVDRGDPLRVAPHVTTGRTGELLVDGQSVDVGADLSGGELAQPLDGSGVAWGVVGAHHEADGDLVVRVEVGVVVAAHGEGHQGPTGYGTGDLETGGSDDPLGGRRRPRMARTAFRPWLSEP